jgi:hypothetical protein
MAFASRSDRPDNTRPGRNAGAQSIRHRETPVSPADRAVRSVLLTIASSGRLTYALFGRGGSQRYDSGSTARADHSVDASIGDDARTLLCDDQLPHIEIERSDRTLD